MNLQSLISAFSNPMKRFDIDQRFSFSGPTGVVRESLNHPCLFRPSDHSIQTAPKKIGIVFSGGPASGGHDVLCGILMNLRDQDELIGFCGGPKGLLEGKTKSILKSDIDDLMETGGFDFLGTDRTKISTDDQFELVRMQIKKHGISALIIVGGDDSNTNALYLANASS